MKNLRDVARRLKITLERRNSWRWPEKRVRQTGYQRAEETREARVGHFGEKLWRKRQTSFRQSRTIRAAPWSGTRLRFRPGVCRTVNLGSMGCAKNNPASAGFFYGHVKQAMRLSRRAMLHQPLVCLTFNFTTKIRYIRTLKSMSQDNENSNRYW